MNWKEEREEQKLQVSSSIPTGIILGQKRAGNSPAILGVPVTERPATPEEVDALRAQYTDLQQAIHAGAQLQRMLCSPRFLERGSVEIASEIFPVRHLSGDFCKVLDLSEEIGLLVGDIAGKGITAGLWLPHLIGLVRAHAEAGLEPTEVMHQLNQDLCRLHPSAPITALFYARLNPGTGQMSYCNAGLPAPMLLRARGSVEWLQEGGTVLGVMSGAKFVRGVVRMEPGDVVVGYSDGITEARNVRDEEFGSAGLVSAARRVKGVSASMMLYSLIGAVQDYAASRPRGDDLTLLVARRRSE
jgi:sigma-B regulation protein RsbU (phosphoserine phosphatase)